jgi:hypothetical protein
MTGQRPLRLKERIFRWTVAGLILLGTPAGVYATRQALNDNQSPAEGSAQVVAQGLATLPRGKLVWRVVERVAKPRGEAEPGTRVNGYVLAQDESILLINVVNGQMVDTARLAPGEAFAVQDGTSQIRASMTDQPVTYLSLELVPEDQASSTGSGTLVFATDAFEAPEGMRDIDLVANVLSQGEEAQIPYSGGQIAILATEGTIDILPEGGAVSTLQPGQTSVFNGPVTVRSSGGASVSGVRAFANLVQSGSGDAVYFAVVIGTEVIPSSDFQTPTPTAPATQPPVPTEIPIVATEAIIDTPTEISTDVPTETPTEIPTEIPMPTSTPDLASDDDGDGLPLRTENAIGTDPTNPDTDGDGYNDGAEVQAETDPLDPNSYPIIIG